MTKATQTFTELDHAAYEHVAKFYGTSTSKTTPKYMALFKAGAEWALNDKRDEIESLEREIQDLKYELKEAYGFDD